MRICACMCGSGEVRGREGCWVLLAQGGGNDTRWVGEGKVRVSVSVVNILYTF